MKLSGKRLSTFKGRNPHINTYITPNPLLIQDRRRPSPSRDHLLDETLNLNQTRLKKD